jgi:membrane protein implicated in regulation of membrane protease activity
VLDLGIDLDVWPWIWLFVAVTFTLLEVTLLGGSFILLPFAASAFVASLLGFYDVSVEAQWAVFVLGGAVLWIGFYRWAKTFLRDHVLPPGVGADRLIGMTGTVTVAVTPDDSERRGRISVEGETWGVITSHEMPLSTGTKVRILSMQGARLVVEPIETDDAHTGDDRP